MDKPASLSALAADSDYDPNSMPVAKAREYIRAFLTPIAGSERCTSAPRSGACWPKTCYPVSTSRRTTIRRWTATQHR